MENPLLIHKHLIVRAEINNPPKDVEYLKSWMSDFIKFINMKVMLGPYVAYCDNVGNKGITGVAVIETSHIAIHVWDEPNPALMQLDVYSCANFDPYKIAEKIKTDFSAVKCDYKFLNRITGLKSIKLNRDKL